MKWSDGEPATCEDACYSVGPRRSPRSGRGYIGSGYLEPYLTNAGLTIGECTDANTLVVNTDVPDDLLTQAYVPILPKHIWASTRLEQIGRRRTSTSRRSSAPARTRGRVGARPVHPDGPQPELLGHAGLADEIIFQTFAEPDTMVQALKSGELDYVRGIGADQFDALATSRQPGRRGLRQRLHVPVVQHPRHRHREGYRRGPRRRSQDPAFRDALGYAIDRQRARRRACSTGTACPAPPTCRRTT